MTKLIQVNIDAKEVGKDKAQEWVHEITDVCTDMEISDVNVTGKKISFQTGLLGMDDITVFANIGQKIDEYVSMAKVFWIKDISCG